MPRLFSPEGNVTGSRPVGPEVRGAAGSPHAVSLAAGPAALGGQFAQQPVLGAGGASQFQGEVQKVPSEPQEPAAGQAQAAAEPGGWTYSAGAGPAAGGAMWNGGGGKLAQAISGPGRTIEGTVLKAIEP